MTDGLPKPRLLESSVVLATADSVAMSRYQSQFAARSRIMGSKVRPAAAVVCARELDGCQLFYTIHTGRLIREADSPGHDLAVGVVLSGEAHLSLGWESVKLVPGDVVLQLPGHEALHFSEDLEALTVRIPVSSSRSLALLAMPHSARSRVRRIPTSEDSADIASLAVFAAREAERTRRSASSDLPVQLRVLGRAVAARALAMLDTVVPPVVGDDPETLAMCVASLDRIKEAGGRRVAVAEMARAANCSVRTLYRAFARVASIGPSEFELRCRLCAARLDVLRAGLDACSADDVWSQYDFQSAGAFRHAYRAEFGETPFTTAKRRLELWQELTERLDAPASEPSSNGVHARLRRRPVMTSPA